MRRSRHATGLVVVAALAVALGAAACGARNGGGTGQPQAGAGRADGGQAAPRAVGPGSPAPRVTAGSQPPAGPPAAAERGMPAAVAKVLERAHDAERLTHTATYGVILAGGPTVKGRATVRVVNRAPRFRFELVQGRKRSVSVFDGKLLHACDRVAGRWRCDAADLLDQPSLVGTAFPLAVLEQIDSLRPGLEGGLQATKTTRTVRGHKVDCATYVPRMRFPPPAVEYCVRPDGVLAYARTSDGQVLELTAFRPSANPAELAVPR
jgi:hypothetical protein